MPPSRVGEILVQRDELEHRVRELAEEVSRDYADRDLLLVGVLKGAVFFLSDLMRHLAVDCEVDFMAVSSYGSPTGRSPAGRVLQELGGSLEVCALLTKPERRKVELPIRYVGFEIPNRFAIGYGLDHAERFRNLPFVAVLEEGRKSLRGAAKRHKRN